MATRNIQMNYYNGTDYDVLYPQTVIGQVSSLNSTISGIQGNISSLQSQLNGKLNRSGGTMTGNLTLRGDPTSDLMAATKQYVDNKSDEVISNTQDLVFFDKLLEKECVFNSSNGSAIATGLNTEITNEIFLRVSFCVISYNISATANICYARIIDYAGPGGSSDPITIMEIDNSSTTVSNLKGAMFYPFYGYYYSGRISGDDAIKRKRYGYVSIDNNIDSPILPIDKTQFTYINCSNCSGTIKFAFYGVK